MWFVYVIKSTKNGELYKGITGNLEKRISDHNSLRGGRGGSYTSKNAFFELIFFEGYKDKKDASIAEKFWKSGRGREVLKDKLKYSLG